MSETVNVPLVGGPLHGQVRTVPRELEGEPFVVFPLPPFLSPFPRIPPFKTVVPLETAIYFRAQTAVPGGDRYVYFRHYDVTETQAVAMLFRLMWERFLTTVEAAKAPASGG
jgi:hypothetical protein